MCICSRQIAYGRVPQSPRSSSVTPLSPSENKEHLLYSMTSQGDIARSKSAVSASAGARQEICACVY